MMLMIMMENISVFSEKWSSAKLIIKGVIVEAADLTEKYKLNSASFISICYYICVCRGEGIFAVKLFPKSKVAHRPINK